MNDVNNTYICDSCNQTFKYINNDSWSDEKAVEEAENLFGKELLSLGTAIVCDVCYYNSLFFYTGDYHD